MTVIISDFSCMKGGMTIRGKEFHNPQSGSVQTPVIISHGFTSDMSRSEPYAEYLASYGYHAFVFDFCGGGFNTVSDGSFSDYMTPLTEADDLKAVIESLKDREDLDMQKLILMGCSQGGFVSALVAADLKDAVHGLALFYPAFCIPDDARAGSMQIMRFDPENIPPQIGSGKMVISGSYARSVRRLNIFEEIAPYRGNVLLIHGTGDDIVNYGYSLIADDVYRKQGASSKLHLIKDAPHGFHDEEFIEACTVLRGWADSLQ